MASSTSAHVKNIREPQSHDKDNHLSKGNHGSELSSEKKGKQSSAFELMRQTVRYEKYCKYWSILSNVAAVISVGSAILGIVKKRNKWF